jgi:hypothetical protein
LRGLDFRSGVIIKTTAFLLGMGSACLVGVARPGHLFASPKSVHRNTIHSNTTSVADVRFNANETDVARIADVPPEGPLDRFKRNLLVASSSGSERDKQYLANQLDLFSVKATPLFRRDLLAADRDLRETSRLAKSSPTLSRSAARFLAVAAADYVVDRNFTEARRLIEISERLQPGLEVQRTVRAALFKLNARSEDILFKSAAVTAQPETLVERILNFVLGVIILAIVALAAVFGYLFYRRHPGLPGIGSIVENVGVDTAGYIGKIRKLVVVPGNLNKEHTDGGGKPPEDQPAVKLKRAA